MKKASKSLNNPKYWIQLIRKVFLAGFIVSVALMTFIEIEIIKGYYLKKQLDFKREDGTIEKKDIDRVKKELEKISCKSPIWISNSLVLFA